MLQVERGQALHHITESLAMLLLDGPTSKMAQAAGSGSHRSTTETGGNSFAALELDEEGGSPRANGDVWARGRPTSKGMWDSKKADLEYDAAPPMRSR